MVGERGEGSPSKERLRWWWIPKGADVFPDPSPRGKEPLGILGELLKKKGLSPRRSKDGNRVCLKVREQDIRHIPEEDANYGYMPGVGWVREPPPKTPKSGATKKQLGLGGGFSEISRVPLKRK